MKNKSKIKNQDRRDFIHKTFSSCALFCLAKPNLVASDLEPNSIDTNKKHKFLKDSGKSWQAVYNFALKWYYIPAMKNLMDQIGKKEFLELLKKSSESIQSNSKRFDKDYPLRSLSEWIKYTKQLCGEKMKDEVTFDVVKENKNEFEIKITECLIAKTFREAKASEIGYAGFCYQDYEMAKNFNPKLELIREKTLMKGDDYCHAKWVLNE